VLSDLQTELWGDLRAPRVRPPDKVCFAPFDGRSSRRREFTDALRSSPHHRRVLIRFSLVPTDGFSKIFRQTIAPTSEENNKT
jgi:hypothetical protein